ncbi:iron chelate uptake ABC transporter family permease subunit [Spirillospora sp. CA-108201]
MLAASPAVGARALSPGEVWDGLYAPPDSDQPLTEIRLIVQTVRAPRTVLAIVAGAALGVAGALIQGCTRSRQVQAKQEPDRAASPKASRSDPSDRRSARR